MATINYWPSLAFLDNRYVNVTGDTMTGDLHIDNVSPIALKVDDDTGGGSLDTFVVDTQTPSVGVGGGALFQCINQLATGKIDITQVAFGSMTWTFPAVGTENQPVLFIDDNRAGALPNTADELGEATIVIDTEGLYALYVLDGRTRFDDHVEFDGITTIGISGSGSLTITDEIPIYFGSGIDAWFKWDNDSDANAHYLNTVLKCNNAGYSGNWIISQDENIDWTHAIVVDPHLYIQSADATTVADYVALWHDQTDGNISVGAGDLKLTAAGGDINCGDDNVITTGAISGTSFILEGGANDTTIVPGVPAAAITYTWPTNVGAAGTSLTDAAGDGILSWAAGGGEWTDGGAYLHPADGNEYVACSDTGTRNYVDGDGDLYVEDELEVDGNVYFQGTGMVGIGAAPHVDYAVNVSTADSYGVYSYSSSTYLKTYCGVKGIGRSRFITSGPAVTNIHVHGLWGYAYMSAYSGSRANDLNGVYGQADANGCEYTLAAGIRGWVETNTVNKDYSGHFKGGDFYIELGDAAGANKIHIMDSAPAELISIDSDGHIRLAGDSRRLYFGVADDAYMEFDGDSFNIVANAVGALDDLEITADEMLATVSRIQQHVISDSATATYQFYKKRDGDPSDNVVDGDTLGKIVFSGYHTDGYDIGATIRALVDGTPGNADLPTDLDFFTTPDGLGDPIISMKLDSEGGIFVYRLKSGADQAGAGAAANEIYIDTDDQTLKVGT